jgi:putative ABC transport system permease protein
MGLKMKILQEQAATSIWVETTTPVLYDLNTEKGIQRYGFDSSIFKNVEFLQLKTLEGNDASCLNLNLVQNPGILGVNTKALSDRNSFSFTKILGEPLSENPWLSLNHFVDSNIYDAMVDQTVLTWGLMKEVGDTLFYTDEFGQEIGLAHQGRAKKLHFPGTCAGFGRGFQKTLSFCQWVENYAG